MQIPILLLQAGILFWLLVSLATLLYLTAALLLLRAFRRARARVPDPPKEQDDANQKKPPSAPSP